MRARLPTHLAVAALLRRVNDAGGLAMVRARGDADDGTILLLTFEKSRFSGIFLRERDLDGRTALVRIGPADDVEAEAIEAYWQRRRQADPDLWVVELDVAAAERFAAETILLD